MLCPNCGKTIQDDSRFCSFCGGSAASSTSSETAPSPPLSSEKEIAQSEAGPDTQAASVAPRECVRASDVPLAWFKFIIYFQLFCSAFMCLTQAFNLMTGAYYGRADVAPYIFEYYAGLKTFSTVCALLTLGLAVFAVYTRFRLARFCANGPTLYYIYILLQIGLDFILSNGITTITGVHISFNWIGTVTMLGFLLVNYLYFSKRSYLFIKG